MRKQILILTKSNKRRDNGEYGKCVAGISLDPSDNYKWFRLVADSKGDSVSDSFPYKTLDVIDVELYPCPLKNQIENCQFKIYGKVGEKSINDLQDIFDNMPHSFFGSMSEFATDPNRSLTIFFARNLHLYWAEQEERDKNGDKILRRKVDFDMGSNHAECISMTDPEHYGKKDINKTEDIQAAICVASLPSNSYANRYPKFIASIFPVD